MAAKSEHLVLVNRAELLDDGRRLIMTVRLMKAEELHSSG
jgi:hypothetical protein